MSGVTALALLSGFIVVVVAALGGLYLMALLVAFTMDKLAEQEVSHYTTLPKATTQTTHTKKRTAHQDHTASKKRSLSA